MSHLREGSCSSCKATGAAREPAPRPFTLVGEPIPRTGRHWELNPGPLDLQTNALPTELTGRFTILAGCHQSAELPSLEILDIRELNAWGSNLNLKPSLHHH